MAVFSSCGQSPVWPCISAYAHSRVTGWGHDLSAFVYERQTAQACKITYFMQLVVCCTALQFLYDHSKQHGWKCSTSHDPLLIYLLLLSAWSRPYGFENKEDFLSSVLMKMCPGWVCIRSGWSWSSHDWDGSDMIEIGWQSLSARSRQQLWRQAPSDSRSIRLGNQPFSWEVFAVTVRCGCLAAVFLQAVNLHRH